MKPLYFAAYSRVSLDEQRKGISPEDQVRRIHEWARHQSEPFQLAQYGGSDGKEYYAEFLEDYSGFEYERPEMDVVRELAKLGLINALVVLRTDRFARDEAVFMLLERYFKKLDVRLFSVEEGEFTPGVVNRYVAAFQRARAEDEATTAKRRMQQARHAYIKSGVPQSQGHPLFGYTKIGKKRETQYVINEEQSKIVQLIFELYVNEGFTGLQIAVELNKMGVPSPGAHKQMKHKNPTGKWIDVTVLRVLKNSAYIGKLIGYQHVTIEGQVTPTSKDEHVVISIPPIIDEETWELAQYKLEHVRNLWFSRREGKNEYLLSGMVLCTCGRAMCGTVNRKPNITRYYYRCSGQQKNIIFRTVCHNHVRADDLELTVWDFVERLATDTRTTMALYQQEQQAHEELHAESRRRIEAIDELLEENRQEHNRLNWMYQKRRCDDDYFEAEWNRLEGERAALGRERDKALRVLEKQQATARQIAELERIGEEIRSATEEITFERKRQILERLRTVVTLNPSLHHGNKHHTSERHLVIEVLGYATGVRLKQQTPS